MRLGLRPDVSADLDAVNARHHHVEDRQVELFGVELAQRLRPVLSLGDFESFHAEIQPDYMQQSRFVIDEKDALLGQRVRPPGRVDRWSAQYRATEAGELSDHRSVTAQRHSPWRVGPRAGACPMMCGHG